MSNRKATGHARTTLTATDTSLPTTRAIRATQPAMGLFPTTAGFTTAMAVAFLIWLP